MSERQLDRIEQKMDRILELLEGKELSVSVKLDGKKVASVINDIYRQSSGSLPWDKAK
ncbi:hypothetical protein ACUXCC_005564 [Cytobacillus horneckiae]|uniref:hypothetical protein n=1 Tax=Cytobacillus horneckiae TaxID=549687 RepID=UPI0019D2FC10|nr:hypothetical protein [Cytobacillus horneckiae]MBN6890063.1 hypothetical protein [Cytobacillus horneckiae]